MGACRTPIRIKNPRYIESSEEYMYLHVPCGKCHFCKHSRVNSWVFRLNQEAKNHSLMTFASFSYATTPLSPNGYPTLDKSDFQRFLKRLRKKMRFPIKYYACGEYGSEGARPHYHAIIFGATNNEIDDSWVFYENQNGSINGHVHYGHFTGNSAAYCAKYIDKPFEPLYGDYDDRIKHFSVMSKGIGLNFLTPQMVKFFEHRQVPTIHLDGQWQPLPRYYKDKLFTEAEKKFQALNFEIKTKQLYEQQVAACGSEQEYERRQAEFIKASFENAKQMLKLKRNKL